MARWFLGVALLLLPAGPLAAGEKAKGPKGPPPQIRVVELDPGGRPLLLYYEMSYVPQLQEYTVNVGNRVEKRQRTVMVPVLRQVKVKLDAEGVRIRTVGGKRVEPRNLDAYVKGTTPVLVSSDGKDVDPFYLRLLRPDGLIVIAPELAAPPRVPAAPALPGGDEKIPEKRPPG
jgi:hypothetical protein